MARDLRSGAVTILTALPQETGHRSTYQVGHVIGHGWTCSCRRGEPGSCAHVAAVALATGHDTPARRERSDASASRRA